MLKAKPEDKQLRKILFHFLSPFSLQKQKLIKIKPTSTWLKLWISPLKQLFVVIGNTDHFVHLVSN